MIADDEREIARLTQLYAAAVDAQRWELFDLVFTPDVDAQYPSTGWTELEAFKRDFAASHARLDGTHHMMGNHLAQVDGDAGHAMTYVHFRLIKRATAGGDLFEGSGWYDDDLVRTTDGWRISRRHCKLVWWGGNPGVVGAPPGAGPETYAIAEEAAAGRIPCLDAIRTATSGA